MYIFVTFIPVFLEPMYFIEGPFAIDDEIVNLVSKIVTMYRVPENRLQFGCRSKRVKCSCTDADMIGIRRSTQYLRVKMCERESYIYTVASICSYLSM